MHAWIMVHEGDDSPYSAASDAIGPFDDIDSAEAYLGRFKRLASWGHVLVRRKPTHVPIYPPVGEGENQFIAHCPAALRGAYASAIAEAEAAGLVVTG